MISTPSSWEKMRKCPLYQRHREELVEVRHNDEFGNKGRWKSIIPRGACIIYKKCKTISARYCGRGLVFDDETKKQYSLNAWCILAFTRRPGPPTAGGGKIQISAPQNCSVIMRAGDQEYFVRLKLFDYIHLEKLVDSDVVSFVSSDPITTVDSIPGLVEQYEDELDSNEMVEVSAPTDEQPMPQLTPISTSPILTPTPLISTPPTSQEGPYSVAHVPGSLAEAAKDFKGRAYMHTLWNAFYQHSTALCIMCRAKEITFGHSDIHASHVNARANAGANNKTYNRIIACINCNGLGGTAHLFDQLCYAGRQCQIVPICDVLLRLYCESECHVNYTFMGRRDFVERVYGVEPQVPGGIKHVDVLKVLDAYDSLRPLPEEARNPLLYCLHRDDNANMSTKRQRIN